MEYLVHVVVIVLVFAVVAESLDLLAGHTGLLSVCQAGFWGLGAYCSALLTSRLGCSFTVGVIGGILVSIAVSFVISFPSLRLREDFFVIASFGLQVILFSIFNNWIEVTRGPFGISGIAKPVVLGWRIDTQSEFLVLAICFAICAYLVVWRITTSPFGRVLHCIREDEAFARAYGKNTLYFKMAAFAISAALAAMAGSLYAHYITYIDPTTFTVMESILIISMVIIGGAGSLWGPLVGAVVLVTLPEALRFLGLPNALAANLRQIIYGILLVTMLIFRPWGLVGRYRFIR